MPSAESFYLLREFIEEVQQHFRDLPSAMAGLWTAVLFPFLACISAMALISLLILRLKRVFVPLSAAELHIAALYSSNHHKKQQQHRNLNSTTQHQRQALEHCLRLYPNYTPARISLGALLLYRQGAAAQALAVLRPIQHLNETKSLLLDAKAVQTGCAVSMLQVPLREEEYLSPAYAKAAALAYTPDTPAQQKKLV